MVGTVAVVTMNPPYVPVGAEVRDPEVRAHDPALALYGGPDGDVSLCREAFDAVPISGVFCYGEIGPVGGTTHLHGYTASWGFLVPNNP